MKQIKLQSMSLSNFKGISELELQFQDQSFIYGDNGTGKTTVFDAFTWCMFGKDSQGKSDSNFSICPVAENGKVILKRDPYVECALTVDGKAIKFGRKFCEVWSKPRGTAEEILTGHKTEFYVNDVKQATKKDYDAEVATIIPEDLFKIVTNPFYFTGLKPDQQKELLFAMAGNVTDEDIISLKPDFAQLMSSMQGRPLATFLKEMAAKKRAIKEELDVIPSSIETAQKLRPEEKDWKSIEKELADKRAKLADIDARIADVSKAAEAENARKLDIQRQIGDCNVALSRRESEIKSEGMGAYNEAKQQVLLKEHKIDTLRSEYTMLSDDIARIDSTSKKLEEQLNQLRAEYRSINAEQLQFPEGVFVCPTCKRPLEPEDIEAKQHEMEENFNRDKSLRLNNNKDKGLALKEEKCRNDAKRDEKSGQAEAIANEIAKQEAELQQMKATMPNVENPEAKISADSQCVELKNKINDLKNQLTVDASNVDNSDLLEGKSMINSSIEELIRQLAERDQCAKADKEIKKLEERRVAANQELADLERLEFIAIDFQKTKDAELLKRINGMFSLVSFSFVDEQMNGGEKLTCECTVNGTPYPDVNNAGKINAGLDIINAICRKEGITAPIFIDNRESVNTLIPTLSQVINLVVSTDKNLIQKPQ